MKILKRLALILKQLACPHRIQRRSSGYDWSETVCTRCGLRQGAEGRDYGRDWNEIDNAVGRRGTMREPADENRVLDDTYCRLRCPTGSEDGECPCKNPRDCPNPPRITPMALKFLHFLDQWEARMKFSERKKTTMYPNLLKLIHWIAAYNGESMKGEDPSYYEDKKNWPEGYDLEGLERSAAKLSPEEKEIVATGEDTEANQIVIRHGVYGLAAFLEEVSNDSLSSYFFEE